MSQAPDLVPIVEAAYRLDQPDQEWLSGLLELVAPLINGGWGVGAFFFDMSDVNNFKFTAPLTVGATPEIASVLATATAAVPPDLVKVAFGAEGVFLTSSQAVGMGENFVEHPLVQMFGHPYGMYDLLAFKI